MRNPLRERNELSERASKALSEAYKALHNIHTESNGRFPMLETKLIMGLLNLKALHAEFHSPAIVEQI